MLLLMSFASPYWIQSYQETFSEFKHMGLWEYCFEEFRYPYYPFDKVFNGCHYIFSHEYYVIRDWLLPAWLMVVQAFVTLGLILSFITQIIVALELIRWPLKIVLKYEYLFSSIAFVCSALTAALLFLAVAIFGGQSWRRDWLMYPTYNYLSWSYGFACLAFMFHGVAALFIYLDARKNYEIKKESKNLVVQMDENPNHNGGYV
ncbi:conserved hypothetical protein [Pediculus humanus corporis]|uniref:Uncharacterized protein n=1 Tax=Pediculus humanus subsp. corporis TaxID=121224 RepID=E0VM69_PEDHC|nr:uncharacterized protein Phum_PHUM302480 [Pediculus humanus corporis]EEB14475.1 conserved hypothetical protein [Pediculus humanus corporis]